MAVSARVSASASAVVVFAIAVFGFGVVAEEAAAVAVSPPGAVVVPEEQQWGQQVGEELAERVVEEADGCFKREVRSPSRASSAWGPWREEKPAVDAAPPPRPAAASQKFEKSST